MNDKETLYEGSLRGNKKKEDISLYDEEKIKSPSILNDEDMEFLGYCSENKIKEVKIKDEIYPIYKISKPKKEKIEGYKTKKCEKNKKNKISKKEPEDQYQKKKKIYYSFIEENKFYEKFENFPKKKSSSEKDNQNLSKKNGYEPEEMEKSKYRIKPVIKIKKKQKERKNFEFYNKRNSKKGKISENYQQFNFQEFINCEDISKEKIILEINKNKSTIKEYKKKNAYKIKVQLTSKEQIKDKPDKIKLNNIDKKDINYQSKDKILKFTKKEQNTASEFYLLENNAFINESYKSKQEGDEIKTIRETYITKFKSDEKNIIIEPKKIIVLLIYFFLNGLTILFSRNKDFLMTRTEISFKKKNKFSILYLLIIITSFINLEKTVLGETNSIFFNINQTGCHRIYFSGSIDGFLSVNIQPERVYVNGVQISPITDFYCFDQIDNIIEFQWDLIGTDIGGLFHGCSNITKIDLSKFGDSSNIVIMHHLFSLCSSLTSIDFTNFRTDSTQTFDSMFLGCFSLKELNLSSFDTSNAIYLNYMFDHCTLLTSLDITNFNTEKANYMHHMFSDGNSLITLDLSNFNTENVKSMNFMFAYCYSLTSLDLSKFNTSSVKDLRWMFVECKNLSFLDISNFNTNMVTNMDFMFYGCESLTSLDLFHFKTNKVVDMQFMFHGCFRLKYLNISNFNTNLVENMKAMFLGVNLSVLNLDHFITSNVKDMSYMFYDCISLTSLSISNFDTRNVQDMTVMFYNCSSLSSLNLSNFDTSSVTSMQLMFSQCRSLEYLDLSNLNNDNLKDISWMFYECYNLSYINLSNFKTPNVHNMGAMFVRCWKLTSLDLSSFNTSLVNNTMHMFEDCHNLTSLDLSNFDTNSIEDMKAMFLNCSKLTSLNLENFLTPKVSIMNHVFFGCYDLKYINLKNVIIKDDDVLINNMINYELKNPIICIKNKNSLNKIISLYECPFIINCSSGNWGEYSDSIFPEDNNKCINNCLLSKYESDCYEICSYFIYFDENSKKYLCTKSDECPDTHSKLIPEKNECMKPDITITTEYKLEFSEYIEYNSDSYQKIITTDFVVEEDEIENVEYITNSYQKIITTDFVIEEDEINCPWYKPFLLKEKIQKCVYDCKIRQRQNEICITDYVNKKDDNFSTFDIILNQTRNELIKTFDKSVINGNIIKENGINISITQTNQLNNNNDYYLNFSKCEKILKHKYNLSENDPLYILRIDSEQEGMKVPSFYYELFYLNNETKNLEKADLLFCKGIKIDIFIPINLTGNIDVYNATSDYYNDICYTADSDHGTDIILSDRQNEFIDNNKSICEPNCDFVFYNNDKKKAVCSCDIKTEIPFMANLKFDKNVLKDNFMDIKNLMNIKLLKCYKTVFQFKKILKNYGFFIYIIIILINLICFLLFIIEYFKELIEEVNKIKISIINFNEHNLKNINVNKNKNRKKNNRKSQNSSKIQLNQKNNENNCINNENNENILFQKIKKLSKKNKIKNNNKNFPPIKKSNKNLNKKTKKSLKESFHFIEIKNENINNHINPNNILFMNNNSNNNKSINRKKKQIFGKIAKINLNNLELNSLTFKEALLTDKRAFVQYYISLLKINHIIIFICNNTDYNSRIIKITIFLFSLSAYITINALFFNDSTMHKIYTDKGSYNIIYQLPQIIYSSLISGILNFIIKFLGLSEKSILKFKKEDYKKENANNKYQDLMQKLKIKFTLYFVMDFLLLIFFWYDISCFCGIYRNTQIHLIKDSLLSFATGLITPLIISLFPGIFRLLALKNHNECLYKFSTILQMF